MESFTAGFEYGDSKYASSRDLKGLTFKAKFEDRGAFPFPAQRCISRDGSWVGAFIQGEGRNLVRFASKEVEREQIATNRRSFHSQDDPRLDSLSLLFFEAARVVIREDGSRNLDLTLEDSPYKDAVERIENLLFHRRSPFHSRIFNPFPLPPFSSAPVRSRPRRTYDPTRYWQDPEGQNIPTFLASVSHRDQQRWQALKSDLESFGRESGLFDELSIKSLGRTEGTPFQVQIRRFSGRIKGPYRNLIDVGYGVSQVLPVLTELLNPSSSEMFLLQQPEVHLHPSAQAALGSLFCSIAERNRQLIVETHSDYLLDRVRMDIRDRRTALTPNDVSILYFEPGRQDANIHSLQLDENGNILDAPRGYRQFFADELRKSIGI